MQTKTFKVFIDLCGEDSGQGQKMSPAQLGALIGSSLF